MYNIRPYQACSYFILKTYNNYFRLLYLSILTESCNNLLIRTFLSRTVAAQKQVKVLGQSSYTE